MKLTIELERNFGHPDNSRPMKDALLKQMMADLMPKLEELNHNWMTRNWHITGIRAESDR